MDRIPGHHRATLTVRPKPLAGLQGLPAEGGEGGHQEKPDWAMQFPPGSVYVSAKVCVHRHVLLSAFLALPLNDCSIQCDLRGITCFTCKSLHDVQMASMEEVSYSPEYWW